MGEVLQEAGLPSGANSLFLSRWAVGPGLECLCNNILEIAESSQAEDIRHPQAPGFRRTRFDFVTSKAVKKSQLRERGLTSERVYEKLSRSVPSILERFSLAVTEGNTKVDVDSSREGSFIALQLKGEKAKTLLGERLAVWSKLSELGKMPLTKEGFGWLLNDPEVRLGFIPPGPTRRERAMSIKETANAAIKASFEIVFEPVYGYPISRPDGLELAEL